MSLGKHSSVSDVLLFVKCLSFLAVQITHTELCDEINDTTTAANYLLQTKVTVRNSRMRTAQKRFAEKPHARPTKGMTKVEFGILMKAFYGIDLLGATFTTDAVIVTKWADQRNNALIPSGEARIRYNTPEAQNVMWLPSISVTNMDHGGTTAISSSVLVEENGTTTCVERILLTLKNTFEPVDFPFDTQHLRIRIASTIYMADELLLVPTQNSSLWGVPAGLFPPRSLQNQSLTSTIESDGLLQKSRGALEFDLRRSISQYLSTVFGPSVMLLVVTWSTLWLPLDAPFVMPRIAMSSICFLSQISLAQRVASFSQEGQVTLLDRCMDLCFGLQFLSLMLNGVLIALQHRAVNTKFAMEIDQEMIVLFPSLCICIGALALMQFMSLAYTLLLAVPVWYSATIALRFQKWDESDAGDNKEPVSSPTPPTSDVRL